jgi:hypothetical protein
LVKSSVSIFGVSIILINQVFSSTTILFENEKYKINAIKIAKK